MEYEEERRLSMYDLDEMTRTRVRNTERAIADILDAVNGLDPKTVAEAMERSLINGHRTLQQNFWKSIIHLMSLYSKEANYDLRNEDARNFCRHVTTEIAEGRLPGYLRYI